MWLLGRLQPDFKTIADFRKDNGKAIQQSCREFVEICRKLDMFSKTLVAIDGSKFKAVNSKQRNDSQGSMKRRIARTENILLIIWQHWKLKTTTNQARMIEANQN